MATEFISAGMKLKYCAEGTAGTRPTTGYVALPAVVELPALNNAPAGIDVTTLDDLTHVRYIDGLIDNGESYDVTVNGTSTFYTAWETTMMTAYTAAKSAGKGFWFEIAFPTGSGYTNSYYFQGIPRSLGFFGASVNAPYQGEVHIALAGKEEWGTAST